MKIALIGYGKMGKEIDRLAGSGNEVILRITSQNRDQLKPEALSKADVAIEFSRPESVYDNLVACFKAGVPVVTGTTGWHNRIGEINKICSAENGSLLYSSNFSIGVQVFIELNRKLAIMMNKLPGYEVTIEETHHLQKLDAPSGTAITVAEEIISRLDRKSGWAAGDVAPMSEKLPVVSHRVDGVVGDHTVRYDSPIDRITLSHEAKNRQGFATGALEAAKWLMLKKGFFTMDDFLKDFFSKTTSGS